MASAFLTRVKGAGAAAKEKVSELFGNSTPKTVDADYAQASARFQKLVDLLSKTKTYVNQWLQGVKATLQSSADLAALYMGFYEGEAKDEPHPRFQIAHCSDGAHKDLFTKHFKQLETRVETGPMKRIDAMLEELNKFKPKMKERDTALLQHEHYQEKVVALYKENEQLTIKGKQESISQREKRERNESKLASATRTFDDFNTELVNQLNKVWDERFSDIDSVYVDLLEIEKAFMGSVHVYLSKIVPNQLEPEQVTHVAPQPSFRSNVSGNVKAVASNAQSGPRPPTVSGAHPHQTMPLMASASAAPPPPPPSVPPSTSSAASVSSPALSGAGLFSPTPSTPPTPDSPPSDESSPALSTVSTSSSQPGMGPAPQAPPPSSVGRGAPSSGAPPTGPPPPRGSLINAAGMVGAAAAMAARPPPRGPPPSRAAPVSSVVQRKNSAEADAPPAAAPSMVTPASVAAPSSIPVHLPHRGYVRAPPGGSPPQQQAAAPAAAPAPAAAAVDDDPFGGSGNVSVAAGPYQVGDLVEAQFSDTNWYDAQIHAVQHNGTVRVTYTEYNEQETIPLSRVRARNSNVAANPFDS